MKRAIPPPRHERGTHVARGLARFRTFRGPAKRWAIALGETDLLVVDRSS